MSNNKEGGDMSKKKDRYVYIKNDSLLESWVHAKVIGEDQTHYLVEYYGEPIDAHGSYLIPQVKRKKVKREMAMEKPKEVNK